MKKFFTLILFLTLLAGGYRYRENIDDFIQQQISYFTPCGRPITYSIGNFDTRFQLSQEALLAHMNTAEKVWETHAEKELFQYVETGGDITVHLIYDERQASMDELKKIGIEIEDSRETYDVLQAKYRSMTLEYEQQKKVLEGAIRNLRTQQAAYEKDVAYWNNRGGAPKSEYQNLENRRKDINNTIQALNTKQTQLNNQTNTINALSVTLNQLIQVLNLNVEKFNTTSVANGEEFGAGEYSMDTSGQRIQIYGFEDETKLIRLLAHELGHALELMHVDDPEAIMYKYNQSKNVQLSQADIDELISICRF